MERSRSWLSPYPIDGLKQLLEIGANESADVLDRNWFLLQRARIALLEGASVAEVKPLIGHIFTGTDTGKVVYAKDIGIYGAVKKLLTRKK